MKSNANDINFSIIIPAYNAEATIGKCVAALQQQTVPADQYEIIVVDDGSRDGTKEAATAAGARVLQQAQNQGQAVGRNRGIREAKGEIICFTDADCVPQPDWLAEITTPLLADPAIAGSKGVYCTRQRGLTARFVQMEYEDKYDKLRDYHRITFVDTYSAAYRREVLLEVNGFDERFPVAEDRELSYRIAAAGHEMVFQPTAVVCHLHADSPKSYFIKKVQNGYWAGQAIGHFPERRREDTYTPQVMKIQVGLTGVLLPTLAGSLIFPVFVPIALLILFLFLLTTLPFVVKAATKDLAVAAVAPAYLFLRALALGIGYSWRLLRPIPQLH